MSDRPVQTAETDPSAQPPDPMIGQVIDGRYKLKKRLGQGGMGQVYVARQVSLERLVAVKIVHGHYSSDPDLRARFGREAVALAQINHENVLHAYDHGVTDDGRLYLVTELLTGRPLNRLIAGHPDRQMPLMPVVVILSQLAAALEAVHGSLVHRDLKPHNVIVTSEASGVKAKLLDFGIVRPNVGSDLTGTGIIGTPAYMSPEQVRQEPDIDARSDLYSLGVMGYELLTGSPPFKSERNIEVLTAHLTRAPDPLPSERGEDIVPQALNELVMQLLAKERDERPQTALEVKTRLAAIQSRLSGPPTLSPDVVEGVSPNRFTPFPMTPSPAAPEEAPPGASQPTPQDSSPGSSSEAAFQPPPSKLPRIMSLVAVFVVGLGLALFGLRAVTEVAQAPSIEAVPLDAAEPPAEAVAQPAPAPLEEVDVEPPPLDSASAAPRPAKTESAKLRPKPERRRPARARKLRDESEAPKREIARTISDPDPPTPAPEPEPAPPPETGFAVLSGRTITGEQPLIEVLADGAVLGKGAKVRVELEPGTHRLEVRRVGGDEVYPRTVRVRVGEETRARVLLD